MREVPLLQQPNQRLGFQLDDGTNVNITLKTANDVTLFSISTDFKELVDSTVCFPNTPIFTYNRFSGLFIWLCQDDQYPNYMKFGTLHNLYYLSTQDLEGIINAE